MKKIKPIITISLFLAQIVHSQSHLGNDLTNIVSLPAGSRNGFLWQSAVKRIQGNGRG